MEQQMDHGDVTRCVGGAETLVTVVAGTAGRRRGGRTEETDSDCRRSRTVCATFRASLSGTFLQTLPDLVTPSSSFLVLYVHGDERA